MTVKVLEVDKQRKRISLSIRQATEGEAVERPRNREQPARPPREKDLSGMKIEDALSALKKKFGKG